MKTKAGAITLSATGALAITGLGFKPKLVFFFHNGTHSSGPSADFGVGIGVFGSGSPVGWSGSLTSQDATATPASARDLNAAGTVVLTFRDYTAGGTTVLSATGTSLDADGFTINVTTLSRSMSINFLAVTGDEITGMKAGNFTSPTGTGNMSVTGVGFKPDLVLIFNTIGSASTSSLSFGAMDAAGEQMCFGVNLGNGAGNQLFQRAERTDAVFVTEQNTQSRVASFVSMDADGFTLNFSTAGTGIVVDWLAIRGGTYKIGTFVKSITAVVDTIGMGGDPQGVIFSSANTTQGQQGAGVNNDASITIAVIDSTGQMGSVWSACENAANPTVCKKSTEPPASPGSGTADFGSRPSGGGAPPSQANEGTNDGSVPKNVHGIVQAAVQLRWLTNDGVGSQIPFLAFLNPGGNVWTTGDRVKETTTTTGTGDLAFGGAETSFAAFSTLPGIDEGAEFGYAIQDPTNWEVGIGSYHKRDNTFSRTLILASSNAGAAVNWGAGTKEVFCTLPAMHGGVSLTQRWPQGRDTSVPPWTSMLVSMFFETPFNNNLDIAPDGVLEIL